MAPRPSVRPGDGDDRPTQSHRRPARRKPRSVRGPAASTGPGFLSYALLIALFAGSALPLWWSFVIGSRQASDINLVAGRR